MDRFNRNRVHGVVPLTCICCEQTVGVINVAAYNCRQQDNAPYICKACAKDAKTTIDPEPNIPHTRLWHILTLNARALTVRQILATA